jgi:heme exporter protein B
MRALAAIVWKDIVIELRNKESVSSMMMFALLVVVVFSFALDPGSGRAGVLWIAFSFASVIGLNRSLAMELDNECLQGLLLAPVSRDGLYIAKVASNLAFMLIADLVVLPIFCVFHGVPFGFEIVKIFGFAAVGALGFSAVGTILSTIAANTRMREVMLPILQIPLTLPLVVAGYEATRSVLDDPPTPERIPALLGVLCGFTIVYLAASYMVFEYAVEE